MKEAGIALLNLISVSLQYTLFTGGSLVIVSIYQEYIKVGLGWVARLYLPM